LEFASTAGGIGWRRKASKSSQAEVSYVRPLIADEDLERFPSKEAAWVETASWFAFALSA
jgi:hypothetical protein